MRVLLIHNYYLDPGGEDSCFKREKAMLEQHGHEVQTLIFDNADLRHLVWWRQIFYMFANPKAVRAVRACLKAHQVDVVHVHNWAYYASPAILRAVYVAGVPLVVRVPNYRMLCVGAELIRDGSICHLCVGKKLPLAGVRYGCFQGSVVKSALLQAVMSYHHLRGTFKLVTRFVVLSDFAKQLFARSLAVPLDRFVIKKHGIQAHTSPTITQKTITQRAPYFLYVGRISENKGSKVLAGIAQEAIAQLVVLGEGPDQDQLQKLTSDKLQLLGKQPQAVVHQHMQSCRAVLIPSLWYEGLPNVLVEAFAYGTPVLVSDNANLRQFVTHEQNGLHVPMGDVPSWVAAIKRINQAPALHQRLCAGAEQTYNQHYTPQKDYQTLMQIYKEAITTHAS